MAPIATPPASASPTPSATALLAPAAPSAGPDGNAAPDDGAASGFALLLALPAAAIVAPTNAATTTASADGQAISGDPALLFATLTLPDATPPPLPSDPASAVEDPELMALLASLTAAAGSTVVPTVSLPDAIARDDTTPEPSAWPGLPTSATGLPLALTPNQPSTTGQLPTAAPSPAIAIPLPGDGQPITSSVEPVVATADSTQPTNTAVSGGTLPTPVIPALAVPAPVESVVPQSPPSVTPATTAPAVAAPQAAAPTSAPVASPMPTEPSETVASDLQTPELTVAAEPKPVRTRKAETPIEAALSAPTTAPLATPAPVAPAAAEQPSTNDSATPATVEAVSTAASTSPAPAAAPAISAKPDKGEHAETTAAPAIGTTVEPQTGAQRNEPAFTVMRSEPVAAPPAAREPNALDRAVASQVARAIVRHLPDGGQHLILRLTPPELGTVRIEFLAKDGQMSAVLHAEDDSVRQALDRALPQLRSELKSDGQSVELHVERGEQRQLWQDGQGRHERHDQPQTGGDRRRDGDPAFSLLGEDGADDTPSLAATAPAAPILGSRITATSVDALA
jgi:flagellar hook-length control protein FliK